MRLSLLHKGHDATMLSPNRKDLGDLAPFLSFTNNNTQFGSYQNCFLPESMNCFDVQEGIAKAIGNFGEAKTFFRIEPLYDCTDRRALRWKGVASSWTRFVKIIRHG